MTKKIIEEMRERYSKDPLGYAKANEWADALEAEMREPVAERVLTERGLEWEWYWQDPPVGTKLYALPPDAAAVIEQLREALQSLRSDLREPAEREGGLFRHFYDRVQTALAEGKP